MSATAVATESPPAAAGKKKLLLIIGAVVLALLLAGGGAMVWLLKARPVAEADEDEASPAAQATAKPGPNRSPPVFVPLDAFTVNLADRDGERFAQIAVTLEIVDTQFGDQIKPYMPAIRNNILMTLAQKTSAELLTREGKELLARQIQRDALRPLGIEVPEPAAGDEADDEAGARKKAKRRKTQPASYPVRSVQFVSFIIQ